MSQGSSVAPEVIEVVSEALLENIRTKHTTDIAAFLQTLSDDVKNQIFPFTEDNKERIGSEDPPSLRHNKTYPFLHAACQYGTAADVCLLLNCGVDASLCIEGEGTALDVATIHGKLEIVNKLIEWERKLIADEDTVKGLLAKACCAGHQDMAEFWLDKLTKKDGQTPCQEDFIAVNDPLIAACQGEHYQLALYLLQKEVVSIVKETAFRIGQRFCELLKLWSDYDVDETRGNHKEFVAKWNNRRLHVFEVSWLTTNSELWRTLVRINLSHNALETIPEMLLWGLPSLKRLDLSYNQMVTLPGPKTLEKLTESQLTYLKVSNNKLAFPVIELFMLPLLEHLDLSNNVITSLNHKRFPSKLVKPEKGQTVWDCSSLIVLNISGNQILRIPEDISTAKSLKNLYIYNNRLAKLPSAWDCPLTKLHASDNQICEVPDMHVHWSRSLLNLNLSRNSLREIPWTICQLTALHDLNLAGNLITELPPPKDWSIYSLKELCLADNRLLHVENPGSPAPSAKRKSTSFMKKISSGSMLEAAPASVFYPSGSYSEQAAVLSFPELFYDSLTALDLRNNQLQAVPSGVCNLAYLQKLDLSGNKAIQKLPDSLAQLKNLYSLALDGLEIKEPATVVEVLKEKSPQTKNILDKLNERLLNCQPYRGMKLMLVGPKKCGKTALLSCLSNQEEPNDDNGINIGTWTLHDPVKIKPTLREKILSKSSTSNSSQKDIIFSTWDLKGGELNSIIHQCFFTPRALYLLVWDIRDGSEGVEKLRPWLLNIQSRAKASSVIIVATNMDKFKKTRNLEALREEISQKYNRRDGFPDITGIVEVAATGPEGTGICQLREFIYQCAEGMRIKKKASGGSYKVVPLVGRMVPHTFIVLKEIMAHESTRLKKASSPLPPIMKEAELASHIRKIPNSKIETGQDIEEAAEFLSTCGSLVHFSDHLQGLTNLYFLDPVWLYNILSQVANIKSSLVSEGRIRKKILAELYEASGFGKEQFEEYLQLLQRLEILLPISRIEFLIPSSLPKEKPGQDLSPTLPDEKGFKTLERIYKLPYTPPGFWSRLVSRVYVSLKSLEAEGQAKGGRLRGTNKLKRNSRMSQSMRVGLTLSRTDIMYWQQGIFVLHQTGRIMLKPLIFQDSKPGICVQIQCQDGVFKPMGFMVDHIENLIKEWYPGLLGIDEFSGSPLIQRLIPCPVCTTAKAKMETLHSFLQDSQDDCHHFSISELSLATTMGGSERAECPRHPEESLALTTLIPDLLLMDLPVRALDKTLFDFDPKKSHSLGRGGFGEVFRARFRGKNVAVKMLIPSTFFRQSGDSGVQSGGDGESKKSSSGSDVSDSGMQLSTSSLYSNSDMKAELVIEGFSNLRSEVATMSKLRHPCIIHLVGISIQHLCFAMELAPLGDLATFLRKELECQRESFINQKVYHTILDRTLTYKIALQVVYGVVYLHSKKIIYSDLKTDNVLLYSLANDAPINIKLTDYGISRHMDLQGARGMAGPMGFCAPEILRGRTFTEKVDWFSFSMLLYQLISGVWPYDNLKSAIEVRNAVETGIKPAFQYRDYSIVTLFPNLERLMQKCWNDNPLERPSGSQIATVMKNASFVCLKNVIAFDTKKITCLQPGTGELHGNSSRLWLWTGGGVTRQCAKVHIQYFSKGQLYPKQITGPQANCMVQVGHSELIGTKDKSIQLFSPPAVGPQQIVHQKDFRVDAEVLCLCYQPVDKKEIRGRLFAGLADGHVVIFNHIISPSDKDGQEESAWFKSKTLTLENRQCSVLELVSERGEVWIACGNKLRVLSTEVMLLEKSAITVIPRAERTILSLSHHHDNLFCITELSSRVLQYSMANRQLVKILQCGSVSLQRGDCLVSSPESGIQAIMEVSEDEVAEGAEAASESKLERSSDSDPEEPFNFRNSHFESQQPHTATLPEIGRLISTPYISFPSSRRPLSEGDERRCSGTDVPQVHSVLTVKDTLWIGMNNGDTVVTYIDSNNLDRYSFGEVLAVLGLFPEHGDRSGPIRRLQWAGKEHIVSCQEVKLPAVAEESAPLYHYQLLVWQAWGSEDIWMFERIHRMLTEAVEAMDD